MKASALLGAAIALFSFAQWIHGAAPATLVYDAMSGPLDGGSRLAIENGQSVTLAGARRDISRIDVLMGSSNNLEQFFVRFYNVDTSGLPTTLLWESPLQTWTDNSPSHAIHASNVQVPNVRVPDSFAWTVRRLRPTQLSLEMDRLPTLGTALIQLGVGPNGEWEDHGSTHFAGAARIYAVPEPTGALLAMISLAVVATARRGRGRIAAKVHRSDRRSNTCSIPNTVVKALGTDQQ
jgi:hypothetical protein